ncbi:hypothetical protein ACJJTC_016428 [Scirpophaga incertulas]
MSEFVKKTQQIIAPSLGAFGKCTYNFNKVVSLLSRNNLTVGQTLTGTVTFAKDELGRKVDIYNLQYIVCEAPKRNSKEKDKPKPNDEYTDAYKDFLVNWIGKLEGEKLEEAYEQASSRFPDCAAVHAAYLLALDPASEPKHLPNANETPEVTTAWCQQIITISKKVTSMIDQEKLLAFFGIRNDTRPDANKIKQENEKLRGYLVDALCRRGTALCRLYLLATPGAARDSLMESLRANTADLLKLVDFTDSKGNIWVRQQIVTEDCSKMYGQNSNTSF